MAYYDQQEHDDTDAGIFFEYLEAQEGPLPASVEDLFFHYSCYHAGIAPSTVPCTALVLLHALRRLGIVKSWRDQDITWAGAGATMKGIWRDPKGGDPAADPQQQRGCERRCLNRRKNQWRPVAGVLDESSELHLGRAAAGGRDDGLCKPVGSDSEEEIVWGGRNKLMSSPKDGLRRGPVSSAATYKVPLCGPPPYVGPLPVPSYMVPLAAATAAPLYKESRDGFDPAADGGSIDAAATNKGGRFKELHQHKPHQHQEYRGGLPPPWGAEKKGPSGGGGFGAWHPPPHIPHFAGAREFQGLPSIPYYAGQDVTPELVDPFFVGPPCYDYAGCRRWQFAAPGFDLLGGVEGNWRPSYVGYPVAAAASGFAYDAPQGGAKPPAAAAGGQVVGRWAGGGGGGGHQGGQGRKLNGNRNGRGGASQGRGADGFAIVTVGDGLKREAGTESQNSRHGSVVAGARPDLLWRASQEAGKDVFVSQPFSPHHDRPQTVSVGATEGASISVVNNGAERVKLLAVKMLYSSPKGSFSLSLVPPSRAPSAAEKSAPLPADAAQSVLKSHNGALPGAPWALAPGLHLTFKLACTAAAMGLHKAVLLFDFGSQKIVRYITLICEDDIAKAMAPTEPYARPPRPRVRSFYKFVPGVPPPLPCFKKRLEFYPIPPAVKEALLKKETLPVFAQGLRRDNYFDYFAALEFAEELQMQVDIRAYDMQNVTMWKVGPATLGLKVPGLAERRPSVIFRAALGNDGTRISDFAITRGDGRQPERIPGRAGEPQGYVHKVQADEVHLRFSDAFHSGFVCNSRYDIRFSFGRVNIRRAHQGVHAAKALLDMFLFPPPPPAAAAAAAGKMKIVPFNRAVNGEQMSAVAEILRRRGAPPYLIYGPPGTGKTVTVIEAILQVRKAQPNARILACAPSNSAADLLLERLIGAVEKRDMLRLNAYTRAVDEVPQHVVPFCQLENGSFCTPDQAALLRYRVVVTTYLSAAMLDAQEVRPGHFTHIFLDEAGQGTEPEAMVPIGNLASAATVVVLAGDHQQLGPLIRSPVALRFGLDKSYLERLSALPAYRPAAGQGYNSGLVTKLVRNYRSHPAILDLPSRLFYDGELVACAEHESRNSLAEWDGLPNPSFPVVFVGMEGRDEREGSSPSWFNAQEASKVVEVVKRVRDFRRSRVNLRDVGVISPYNQQVCKLKKALASQGLADVKVGSVESFQGQEKRVIVISTVRSSKEYVEFDKKHSLGFLTNPKRFNVAITRAKALLIVVGNPHVLSQDRCWNELLRYCRDNNSYVGCAPPSAEVAEESKHLHAQLLRDELAAPGNGDGDGLPASLKAAVEDPQWPDGTC